MFYYCTKDKYVMSLFLLFNSINYGYTFKVRSHFEKDIFNDLKLPD